MRHTRNGYRLLQVLALACGSAASATASGALRCDVIATAISGSGTILDDGRTVAGVTVGTVITLKVVSHIYGPNVTNPGILSPKGALRSLTGPGLIGGNLTHTNAPLFATGAFLNGTPYVDAYGFTQVGPSTATFNNASAGRISYLAASVVYGNDVTLGTGTYTVASISPGAASTSISLIIPATTATNKGPTWVENGVGLNQSSGTIGAPAPLIITAAGTTPTLTLTSAKVAADVNVSSFASPSAISFPGATAGGKGITFSTSSPGTVLVGLDLSGDPTSIASLISTLSTAGVNIVANPSGQFYGAGSSDTYDAIATFSSTATSFSFVWSNFGDVTLQGIAVVPEPGTSLGLVGAAALVILRRRSRTRSN